MTLGTVKPAVLFTVCAALASSIALGFSSCGGGSSGARPGSGSGGSAATGTGGVGGLARGTGGGAAGAGGSAGGSSGCAIPLEADLGQTEPLVCSPGVQPDPLLTDFTEATWRNTEGKWGCGLTGGIFPYNGPNSTMMTQVDLGNHNLLLSGSVAAGDYAGGGLAFRHCVNTTKYTGVQFTLGGTAAGCDVYFHVQTFDAQSVGNHGGCPAMGQGCYIFPQVKLSATTGQITVHFSDLTGGKPTGADAIRSQIVGLQWQFQSPPPPPMDAGLQVSCDSIGLTITNVKFITQ